MKIANFRGARVWRFFWTAAFLAYSGLVLYLSVYPTGEGPPLLAVPGSDKLAHLAEFALFVILCRVALTHYFSKKKINRTSVALSVAYGGITELTQILIPYRTASIMDWGADILGVGLGITLAIIFEQRRNSSSANETPAG